MHLILMDYHFKGSNDMEEQENNILFHITLDQAEIIAKHFDRDINDLEEYEICELLDKIIDEEL